MKTELCVRGMLMMVGLALLMGNSLAAPLLADDMPQPMPAEAKPAEVKTSPSYTGAPFTHDSLGQVLENMGYEAKRHDFPGYSKYDVNVTEGKLSCIVSLGLSTSQKYLWMTIEVADWDQGYSPSLETVRTILDRNKEMDLSYFQTVKLDDGRYRLQLTSHVLNCISRNALKSHLQSVARDLFATESVWRQPKKADVVAK